MKRLLTALVVIGLSAAVVSTAYAGHRTVAGLVIGGGTGAIVGQAIGHTPQSTIIGAAVGGVTGAIIGSELDRNYIVVHHPSPPQVIYYRTDHYPRQHYRPSHSPYHRPYYQQNRHHQKFNHGCRYR